MPEQDIAAACSSTLVLSVLLPVQQILLVSPHPMDTEHKPCQCEQSYSKV